MGSFRAFLGETEGPFLGADLRSTAGSTGGVKEAPRRRRGCLDAAEHPATLEQRADRQDQGVAAAWGSSRSMSFWKTVSNPGS